MTEQILHEAVSTEIAEPLGVITLGDARRRNPLSTSTMRAITAALRDFDDDPRVRAVFATCTELMRTVHEVRQPVIAEVAGMAFAAGCQLVATCDLAVAGRSARFSTPGVRIGLFCSTPMVALSRAIGRKRAMHMLLTGEPIGAETAADWGLLSGVVDDDELANSVRELALHIAGSSARTVSIGKQAFYRQVELDESAAYDEMGETMATNAMTCDAQEGMSAFLQKRKPVWTDS